MSAESQTMSTVTQSEQRLKAAVDALFADPKNPKLHAEHIITMRHNYDGADGIEASMCVLASMGVLVDHGDLDLIDHALSVKGGYDDPNSYGVRMMFTQAMFNNEKVISHLSTKWNNGLISKARRDSIDNFYAEVNEAKKEDVEDDEEFLQSSKITKKVIDTFKTLDL